ncbi:MAG: VOC family protein [Nocardioidaceae bacterium]|nr:VOC family protein [Nocardioidaceae bacterium]
MSTTTDRVTPAPLDADRAARGELLAPATRMDAVTLHVNDLATMEAYYRDALALETISDAGGVVVLGRGGRALLVLHHAPGLPLPAPGQAGLFHTAFLVSSQENLAATVARAARAQGGAFVGSADHVVSLAFYFTDPEGNGIEIYWDRDRSTWTWDGTRVTMGALRLDPNDYLQQHLTDGAIASAEQVPATIGHVHLQVGDVATARAFYVDTLGFETVAEWNGALFVSAGGYHHHMAMNTWNSAGAPARAATLGLGEVTIVVPGPDDVAALSSRLADASVERADDGRTLSFQDPWRNDIRVTAASA